MARSSSVPARSTDASNGLRRPCREASRGLFATDFDIANDVGRRSGVAAVEDSTRFFIRLDERVGLVNEQRRLLILDIAKDGRWRNVAGKLGSSRQPIEQDEHASFAAAFGRRFQHDERRDVACVKRPGVQNPKRKRVGGGLGQNDISREHTHKRIQKRAGRNRVRPRLHSPVRQCRIGLLVLLLARADFEVEFPDPDAQSFGLRLPNALVFETWEPRQLCQPIDATTALDRASARHLAVR